VTSSVDSFYVIAEDLFKIYKVADLEVVALRGLDLAVRRGEIIAVVGPSGSGKTTLLNTLSGMERPSAGRVSVGDRDLLSITSRDLERYRRLEVGFVWQAVGRNLAPYLTAQENVELPMIVSGVDPWDRAKRAEELLNAVGLGHKTRSLPRHLSGGEQQRVAIAVAMSNDPPLLLADEPTGELDNRTAMEVFRLFASLTRTTGVTTIIVTHYPGIAEFVDRVVAIRDGKVSTETIKAMTFKPQGPGEEVPKDEYVVMDKTGRLQIPQEYIEKLGLGDRVRVSVEGTQVVISPSEPGPPK